MKAKVLFTFLLLSLGLGACGKKENEPDGYVKPVRYFFDAYYQPKSVAILQRLPDNTFDLGFTLGDVVYQSSGTNAEKFRDLAIAHSEDGSKEFYLYRPTEIHAIGLTQFSVVGVKADGAETDLSQYATYSAKSPESFIKNKYVGGETGIFDYIKKPLQEVTQNDLHWLISHFNITLSKETPIQTYQHIVFRATLEGETYLQVNLI